MNLNELQTFLAILEAGSLVRASERLNVTQSTVTARLQSLETELGQSLINRQKSGITPTPAGHKLERYAKTISQLWRQAQQETSLPQAMNSVCNIGCAPDLWSGFVDQILDYLHVELPEIATSVWSGSQADMAGWLRDGLIDVAVGYHAGSTQKQVIIPAVEDRLILVGTSPDRPMRFDPGYIYVEAGDEFGAEHAKAYSDAGVARTSFGNGALALSHLLATGGSAYLPERMVQSHLDNKSLFKIENAPVFKRQAYVIVNKHALSAWPWFNDCLENVLAQQN